MESLARGGLAAERVKQLFIDTNWLTSWKGNKNKTKKKVSNHYFKRNANKPVAEMMITIPQEWHNTAEIDLAARHTVRLYVTECFQQQIFFSVRYLQTQNAEFKRVQSALNLIEGLIFPFSSQLYQSTISALINK